METTPQTANPLEAFVARLRAERTYWKAQTFHEPSEPPEQPLPDRYKLSFRPGFAVYQPTITLDQARKEIANKVAEYAMEKRPNRLLLIKAQPGVGKTHIAVATVQRLAKLGMRILYAMPTHQHWETISEMDHFDSAAWYHWLALTSESPDTGNTMCLYDDEMTLWSKKGYPAMKLCDSLCAAYKQNCEYRRQMFRPEPVIAGVHNHVAIGMSISDFDLVVVDELPLNAFLTPRHIPVDGIPLRGVGPVVDLSRKLAEIAASGETVKGKALLDQVGELLEDVYAQLEDYGSALPQIPWVSRPGDVDQAAWWYLPDLLTLLVAEKAAWESGAKDWLERVIVTKHGLDLLQRAEPWDQLPARLVVLDATGSEEVYKALFDKPVETYAPTVERTGQVYQVVNRLNGIGTFLENLPGQEGDDDEEESPSRRKKRKRLSKQGLEALELCRQLIEIKGYRKAGAVTFKGAVPDFEAVFGEGRVLWFHAQRGSNDLIDVDALFVVGAPQPKDSDIMRAVKILYPRRIAPFVLVDVANSDRRHPARTEELRTYNYFDERGQAERMISGFWNDSHLNALADVQREQELVQAIHRARPITREVDIYLLTSVPTTELLTGIYEDPKDLFGIPEGIPRWDAWLKLVKWLEIEFEKSKRSKDDPEFGYKDVANAAGIPEGTAKRWKLLDIILREFPERWNPKKITPATGGRGRGITPQI